MSLVMFHVVSLAAVPLPSSCSGPEYLGLGCLQDLAVDGCRTLRVVVWRMRVYLETKTDSCPHLRMVGPWMIVSGCPEQEPIIHTDVL